MANMIFNLDLNKNNAINPIIFGRLTDGNLRKITVNITNEGEPVDLTGWVIRFEGVTGGQAKVFDVLGVHLLDAENGKFEYTFSKTAFSASGAYKSAYFAIEKDNMRETTNDIKIVVENVADLNAKDAETVVTELNKTIALINERYAELNSRVDVYEGDIAELESWLDERKAEIENIIDLANSNFNEKLTEIQAKLDETNQAIEKGNETIAYAYSADGTDRFTTVYPNLNLLVNSSAKTKDGFFKNFDKVENGYGEVTIKGTNDWVFNDMWDGFSINPRDYKPGDIYTMSMDIMFTSWNLPAGTTITEFWMGQRYTRSTDGSISSYKHICSIDLPRDPSNALNQWIRITKTSTVPPYEDPSVNTETIFMTKFAGASEGSFTVRVRKPKQEPSSTATPYMPSASEVTTNDYPRYVGYSNKVKTNKSASDYKWFPTITSHINDKNNPHGVTAEQVHAYTKTVTFTKTEIQDLLSDAIAQSKLDANPVGSIITTINDINPSTYLGGTWMRFAQGRTLVGVDEIDSATLMKSAGNEGGSTNPLTRHGHSISRAGGSTQTAVGATINWANETSVGVVQEAGDNTDHNNWQPFMTVYFWRRTA